MSFHQEDDDIKHTMTSNSAAYTAYRHVHAQLLVDDVNSHDSAGDSDVTDARPSPVAAAPLQTRYSSPAMYAFPDVPPPAPNGNNIEDGEFNGIKQSFDEQLELSSGRDFNAEYQEIYDRNAATPHDQQQRAVALASVTSAFVKFSTAVAMAVISTKLYPRQQPPLVVQNRNVGGRAGGTKYIVGNLLLKFAVNEQRIYAHDLEAQKAAALEVHVNNALVELHSPLIRTTMVCIVRYRGYCVFASALLPIHRTGPLKRLVYGSDNAGWLVKDASSIPAVRSVVGELATQLHLREHGVIEGYSERVKRLCMPVDIEVHMGTDDRLYIVDTARILPPTPPRQDVEQAFLTRHFCSKMMIELQRLRLPALSSDAYSAFADPRERDKDIRDIQQAFAHMREQVIPELARKLDISAGGADVAVQFHAMGVNMRYMPSVAFHCTDESVRLWLCEEMLARYLKVRIRHSWIGMVGRSNGEVLDALCTRLGDLFSQSLSDENVVMDGVLKKYADNGDDVLDRLKPLLDDVYDRETNWPLVVRVLRALNVEYDDSLPIINSVEELRQHRVSWRLVPEVTSVKPHAYVPLNEREAQLKAVIEFREQSNLSVVQPLLQLLELYRVSVDAEASRERGIVTAQWLLRIVDHAPEPSYDMAMVLKDVSVFYHRFHLFRDQTSVCERAVAMMRGLLRAVEDGSDDIINKRRLQTGLPTVLNATGIAYAELARNVDALRVYREALALRQQVYGPSHIDVAVCLHNIADAYKNIGNEDAEALGYYTLALEMRRELLGERHPRVADTLNNMAVVLSSQGKYDEARGNYEQALNIRKQAFGESHADLAETYANMAALFRIQGIYSNALEFYEHALTIRRGVFGQNHLVVSTTLREMALVLEDQGEYAKALEYHEQVLRAPVEPFGDDHPDIAQTHSNIANVLKQQGEYAKALEHYEQSLAIKTRVLGDNHPSVAATLNNMAIVFNDQGEYAKALEQYERALAIRTRVLGDNHPDVADALNNMALVFENQGEYAKALEYYERTRAIYTLVLGDNHPRVADTLNNMAVVFRSQGEYAKALELYERTLAIRTRVLGDNHPGVADTLNNIGKVFQNQGEYAKALEHYKRALAIYIRVMGDNHPDVAVTLFNIGLLHQARNSLTDALSCFERAHRIWSATLPPGHQHIQRATNAINQVRSALNE